ncbi:RNA 2',3'-cyclic phosphodiesterase [Archaeoglobus profundus]|uniref:RNA 2',3'-cyclic phosphodiesterase n=1 Tax=Archaeoglobus profundus (strain DSM 5631 / JCM 9629 / NBRC 100127 / Av18) TaxID=572546 RepID=D2RER1_ARCPA|nr:RNA 2',3'-cyclic phosphodiesterase [Archaeoglobus profundus]ADB58605.1 2'-5' RNA ligase [Archaeoglobus profundus DSM 5631]
MRLFVAVDLSDEVREKMNNVLKTFKDFKGVKTVEKENLHITLMFLGEVPDRRVEVIKEKLREIKSEPFKIRLKGLGSFPPQGNIRVVWVGVEEGEENLKVLADAVESSLRSLGFKRDKDFVAHATVARVKRLAPSDKERLLKVVEKYKDYDFGEMVVDVFKLKKSTLTPKGPIYEDIEVYRLE